MTEKQELLQEEIQIEPEVERPAAEIEEEALSEALKEVVSEAEGEAVPEAVKDVVSEVEEEVVAEGVEEVVSDVEEDTFAEADEESISEVEPDAVAEGVEEVVSDVEEDAVAEADEESISEVEEEQAVQEGRFWYVVHSYSGYENKVKRNLETRIESMGMEDYIFEVVVPTEDVVELRDGHRRTVERRVFPGYILVDMIMTDESWFVVRNTPSVTGFVGSGSQPTPLREEEVDSILKRMEDDVPKVEVSFRLGDTVRIVDGPFTDFLGTVDHLNLDKGKARIMVSFFGRETPVELDFLQVERE